MGGAIRRPTMEAKGKLQGGSGVISRKQHGEWACDFRDKKKDFRRKNQKTPKKDQGGGGLKNRRRPDQQRGGGDSTRKKTRKGQGKGPGGKE